MTLGLRPVDRSRGLNFPKISNKEVYPKEGKREREEKDIEVIIYIQINYKQSIHGIRKE